MLEHVYRRTAACRSLDDVLVATCDDEIAAAARAFGAPVVMTSPSHTRATDRVAEACRQDAADIVVMVQGDEPMIRPAMIDSALQPMLDDPTIKCINLAAPIGSEQEARNPNTIKVTMNRYGDALYFSRSPIPAIGSQGFSGGRWYKQVCIIVFRTKTLREFAGLPETPLEIAESVDMLRLLEHGIPVRMVMTPYSTQAVDTPEDLAVVASLLAADDEPWK